MYDNQLAHLNCKTATKYSTFTLALSSRVTPRLGGKNKEKFHPHGLKILNTETYDLLRFFDQSCENFQNFKGVQRGAGNYTHIHCRS